MTQIPTPLPQLKATGNYLTDPDGRVVILRGLNLCSKTAQSPEQLGFLENNAAFLQRCGVSVVRLGLPWTNVQYVDETTRSLQYNMTFLESIKGTIELLAGFGIYTLVDFHQDGYAAPWGFGAPSWAIVTEGTTMPIYGWMVNTFGGDRFVLNGERTNIQTDLNSAFDFFWADAPILDGTTTLWKAYGHMLNFVSGYLKDQQGNILGYDPINEPEPGTYWTEGYVPPCNDPNHVPPCNDQNPLNFSNGYPKFDPEYLGAFYQQCAIPALQDGHPGAMIWFEPNIYFDYNAPTSLPDLTSVGNLGFNFHNYENTSATPFVAPISNAQKYQASWEVPPPLLCSEFGGSTNYPEIQFVADLNDQNMLSAIFWAWFNNAQYHFFNNVDAAAMGVVQDMSQPLEPPNLNQTMLDILTRVYPRLISGTPISFGTTRPSQTFGPITRAAYWNVNATFTFTFAPGPGTTVIVVPPDLYPGDYDVVGSIGVNSRKFDGYVEITVDSPLPESVFVTIQPM